jgi:hypothetical protein
MGLTGNVSPLLSEEGRTTGAKTSAALSLKPVGKDQRPRGPPDEQKDSSQERGLWTVEAGEMKAQAYEGHSKDSPGIAEGDDPEKATMFAAGDFRCRESVVELQRLALGRDDDKRSRGHGRRRRCVTGCAEAAASGRHGQVGGLLLGLPPGVAPAGRQPQAQG